jgi:spermidine synthase
MQPWITLATAQVPGGGLMALVRRGDTFVIRIDGEELMANRMHHSEEMLATLAFEPLEKDGLRPNARVLIGGMGMGYTLRTALDRLGPRGRVDVAELVPEVIEWNRGILAPLAKRPLDDPRVRVLNANVGHVIADARAEYDAIMLDVDNGPAALTAPSNAALYGRDALARTKRALVPNGMLTIWAAGEERGFESRLGQSGFAARTVHVKARVGRGGLRFIVYVGRSIEAREPRPAQDGPRPPRRRR